ncbi:OsmC family protein [Candidatus Bathyarchaeota archaeon]|nr:OsmC family protein [Candidatus Bathyarchaeota archaeon]
MVTPKNKQPHQYGMRLSRHQRYTAEATWNHRTGGTAKLDGFTQQFDTPHEYGGEESAPCPDQLFATSLAGCIMNTFGYYRRMLEAETRDLKVDVSMDIELTDVNGYRVTGIQIDTQVWCDAENEELNLRCAERAIEYCHLTKSIEPAIPITTTIQVHAE